MERKDLQWARVTLKRYDDYNNFYNGVVFKELYLPRAIIERRKWFIEWLCAKHKCQFPKSRIETSWCFTYPDKRTELEVLRAKLFALKGFVTKCEKAILLHINHKKNHVDMFYKKSEDMELKKAFDKLKMKRKEVKLIKQLINENISTTNP